MENINPIEVTAPGAVIAPDDTVELLQLFKAEAARAAALLNRVISDENVKIELRVAVAEHLIERVFGKTGRAGTAPIRSVMESEAAEYSL